MTDDSPRSEVERVAAETRAMLERLQTDVHRDFDRAETATHLPVQDRSPNGRHAKGTPGGRIVVTSLADVAPKAVTWLWPRWLARGKYHLLGGLAGDGKGTLTAWLAAVGSRGGRWPDGTPAPRFRTLFLLAEDALDDTLRPRLDLHGADVSEVFAIAATYDEDGEERFFNVERHLPLLERTVTEEGIDLVVIDPLTTVMPGRDRNAEGDIRDALTPLIRWGEATGVAILGIGHIGKPTAVTRVPMQRILGSTAFHALARIVWMTTAEEDGRMALGVVKSNLAMKPSPLVWSREEDQPIAWHGTSRRPVDRFLDATAATERPRDRAEAFVRELLRDGPRLKSQVEAMAADQRISYATLRRATDIIGVQKFKQKDVPNGRFFWRLPTEDESILLTAGGGEQDRPDGQQSMVLTPRDIEVSNIDFVDLAHRQKSEQHPVVEPNSGAPASEIDVAHLGPEIDVAHVCVLRGEQHRSDDGAASDPAWMLTPDDPAPVGCPTPERCPRLGGCEVYRQTGRCGYDRSEAAP